jgi:hypothetical protein
VIAFLTTADSFRLLKDGDFAFTSVIVTFSPRVTAFLISAESM